jgi:hypothetical protein
LHAQHLHMAGGAGGQLQFGAGSKRQGAVKARHGGQSKKESMDNACRNNLK